MTEKYVAHTTETWMKQVKENREVLVEFIRDWHPVSRIKNARNKRFVEMDGDLIELEKPALKITAPSAEIACQQVRRKIIAEEANLSDAVERFEKAVAENDVSEIMSLLNSAWFGVPESTSCWDIPGFAIAVDLTDDPPEDLHQQR